MLWSLISSAQLSARGDTLAAPKMLVPQKQQQLQQQQQPQLHEQDPGTEEKQSGQLEPPARVRCHVTLKVERFNPQTCAVGGSDNFGPRILEWAWGDDVSKTEECNRRVFTRI